MTIDASLDPLDVKSNEPFTIRIVGAEEFAQSDDVQVVIDAFDDFEGIHWISTITIVIGADGSGSARHPGLVVERETVIWISSIGRPDLQPQRLEKVRLAIVDGEQDPPPHDLTVRLEQLQRRYDARYRKRMGEPSAARRKHRAAFLVEGLQLTKRLHTDHATIHPLPQTIHYEDELAAVNGALEMLGWPSRIDEPTWQLNMRRDDFAVIEFPEVWASDVTDVADTVTPEASRLLDSIALIRHAAPRLVTLIVEIDDPVSGWAVRSLRNSYKGNLVGGFTAGESQAEFAPVDAALRSDPRIALYVSLYLEAQRESQPDSQYFKYWSVLETIAINNIATGLHVVLDDGSTWPDGQTTSQAAPRVFELTRGIASRYTTTPGSSHYEFIRSVYGRRNATAHYGRLDAKDTVQQGKPWYPWALKTAAGPNADWEWLWRLKMLVHDVIREEITKTTGV